MSRPRVRIIVVDDNLADARVISRKLDKIEAFEAVTRHCLSGPECLTALKAESAECVLLDYMLGAENGLETLSAIQQAGYDLPVIMLTGQGDEQVAVEAMKRGAKDYLAKTSIVLPALQRAIGNAVQKVSLEREVRRRQEELERFVSVVAHDLKSPVCSALSSIEVVRDYYDSQVLDDKGMDFVVSAIRTMKRMTALIDALLGYSRMSREEWSPGRVELTDALQASLGNLRLQIEQAGARIEYGDLPAVQGDEMALTQLFQNLIANSLKFRGPNPPEIHVHAMQAGQGLQVSLQDNGIGMPAADCESIFEPFRRLHKLSAYEGLGIGLATCKRVVERHGGKIWAESAPGQGATFHFTIVKPAGPANDGVPEALGHQSAPVEALSETR